MDVRSAASTNSSPVQQTNKAVLHNLRLPPLPPTLPVAERVQDHRRMLLCRLIFQELQQRQQHSAVVVFTARARRANVRHGARGGRGLTGGVISLTKLSKPHGSTKS